MRRSTEPEVTAGARHRGREGLVAVLLGVLFALGAALSICTPVLHASHDAAALRAGAPSIQALSAAEPLHMVVPSRITRADWRLKPVVGLGPINAGVSAAVPVLPLDDRASGRVQARPAAETARTRAPPI